MPIAKTIVSVAAISPAIQMLHFNDVPFVEVLGGFTSGRIKIH